MRSTSARCSAASSVLRDCSSRKIGGVSKSSPSSEPSSPDSLPPLPCALVRVRNTGFESLESLPPLLAGDKGFSIFIPNSAGHGHKSSSAWTSTSLVTPESNKALRSSCWSDVNLDTMSVNINPVSLKILAASVNSVKLTETKGEFLRTEAHETKVSQRKVLQLSSARAHLLKEVVPRSWWAELTLWSLAVAPYANDVY